MTVLVPGRAGTDAATAWAQGGIAAAIYFLYLSAIVLIFGGEINRVIGIHRQNQHAMTRP